MASWADDSWCVYTAVTSTKLRQCSAMFSQQKGTIAEVQNLRRAQAHAAASVTVITCVWVWLKLGYMNECIFVVDGHLMTKSHQNSEWGIWSLNFPTNSQLMGKYDRWSIGIGATLCYTVRHSHLHWGYKAFSQDYESCSGQSSSFALVVWLQHVAAKAKEPRFVVRFLSSLE